jgi:HD-GYP domain-containing protein (c-di-GMP phosphodiesterase class II)
LPQKGVDEMRLKSIDAVNEGELLAKPILLENGSVLVGIGVKLTAGLIKRMKELGIDRVYVEDELTSDIEPEDVISEETRQEAVAEVHKAMMQIVDGTLLKSRAADRDIGSTFRNVFNKILQDLSRRKNVMVNLVSLHTTDGYLFHHAVNVAILAGIVGLSKGYNQQQLEELGVGALLFDVGMTRIPPEVRDKKGEYTAEERLEMQRHTEIGFDLLRSRFDISLLSAHCALQHHERFDGLGYPRGLKGNEIHEYAQIIAIADVYDALTSVRPYRNRHKPSEAIEYLYGNGNAQFNLDLVKRFCEHVCIYPVSTTVMLNTGQIGVISANHPGAVQRPTVRVLREPDGRAVSAPYELDLRKELNVTIISSL